MPSDAEQIAAAETEQTSEGSISDEEYDAVRRPTPQRTSYDPATPVYAVGDTVYIEDDAYQITELRDDTYSFCPPVWYIPSTGQSVKNSSSSCFGQTAAMLTIPSFFPLTRTRQIRTCGMYYGLMDEADKQQISTLLQSGRSNSEIAYWLSRAYSGEIETLNLETGDIADYRTTAQGMELEVLDAEEKRLAVLYFRWDEVAPLLRGMYARQLDGFGQERPEPAAESPTFHSETVAVYPGDKNNLPYDVVERLHIEEPEPPAPATEPEKTFEEVLCMNTRFPFRSTASGRPSPMPKLPRKPPMRNTRQTCAAMHKTSVLPMSIWVKAVRKAKFQANINAIRLLKELEVAGQQASPEQQEVLSRYVGWGCAVDAFDPENRQRASRGTPTKSGDPGDTLSPEALHSTPIPTSPTVIQAIYEAVSRMGFETGNILEPSMGVGNFFGMLPEEMRNSRLYGVELDSISGRIAQQLYPKGGHHSRRL